MLTGNIWERPLKKLLHGQKLLRACHFLGSDKKAFNRWPLPADAEPAVGAATAMANATHVGEVVNILQTGRSSIIYCGPFAITPPNGPLTLADSGGANRKLCPLTYARAGT